MSAKKVLGDLGGAIAQEVELASFHTVSKGVLGECGLRGGYVELTNFHPGTIDELYKARRRRRGGARGARGARVLVLAPAACARLQPPPCRRAHAALPTPSPSPHLLPLALLLPSPPRCRRRCPST